MKIIGLTGTIGSGKTTVSRMIQEMGIPVVCADAAAREVVKKGKPAYHKIVEHFGKQVLQEDGSLDRAKLGSIVFANPEKRLKLNTIVHPEVGKEMAAHLNEAKDQGVSLIVLDVPLLFEGETRKLCDKTIVVFAPETTLIKRLSERDTLSLTEIEDRIRSQMPMEEKVKQADFVIDNSGKLEDTRAQVIKLFQSLQQAP